MGSDSIDNSPLTIAPGAYGSDVDTPPPQHPPMGEGALSAGRSLLAELNGLNRYDTQPQPGSSGIAPPCITETCSYNNAGHS